jgi:hypothetical protein
MSDWKQGIGDVARAAVADIGDAYQAVLQGKAPLQTHLTGDMVRTAVPAEDIPQSYEAALRQHQAMEQAGDFPGRDATSLESEPAVGATAQAIDRSEPDIG